MIRVEDTCFTEIRTRANELNGSRTIFAQTFAIDLELVLDDQTLTCSVHRAPPADRPMKVALLAGVE